ncbi:unnamed protein product [Linum tenue]|uniref:Uncharacterized protein n=1 Tax=Linum tenue TaxID=586396 RepID=A0AAV0J1Y0_9ROSI|nr:unnamed protein product [Linum tenue]
MLRCRRGIACSGACEAPRQLASCANSARRWPTRVTTHPYPTKPVKITWNHAH